MRAMDLSVGVLSSVCIHVVLGIYVLGAYIARWEHSVIVPEFRHGLSSVEVNLVAVAPRPVVSEIIPIEPEVISEDEPPEPPEEPEKEPEEILLDEGVEQGDPEVTTDIKPSYPIGSRMRGEEGSTTVRVWIDAAGRARKTEVLESSGYASLDRAAVKAAKNAHFRDGKGALVYSRETSVTFHFTLVD